MRGIKAGLDAVKKENPNFVDMAAHEVWRSRNPQKVADPDSHAAPGAPR